MMKIGHWGKKDTEALVIYAFFIGIVIIGVVLSVLRGWAYHHNQAMMQIERLLEFLAVICAGVCFISLLNVFHECEHACDRMTHIILDRDHAEQEEKSRAEILWRGRALMFVTLTLVIIGLVLGSWYRDRQEIERYANLRQSVIDASAELSRGGGCGKIVGDAFNQLDEPSRTLRRASGR